MDMQALFQAASQILFPILCSLLCFWFIYQKDSKYDVTLEKNTEAIQELTIFIKEVMAKLIEDNKKD